MTSAPTRITLAGGTVAYVEAHPAHVADLITIARKKGSDRVCLGGNWYAVTAITDVLAPGDPSA